ncbi:adenylate/guanylate cyclase domain-containing protein [Nocardioides pantholopis]|uniref:adenylate/guanylate cyclase domain-containing protein n=1 Tax=Nocardioides pantholopis TaxID=2483798 RepID=UPI001F155D60|nr:adenylate/guanylate cyclase domain-containing protein [Nocardioides pantholopis]
MTAPTDLTGAADDVPELTDAADAGFPELAGALETVEEVLLGEAPTLTKSEVAARAGVPLALAETLWRLLGFAHATDDDVAFTAADVRALEETATLVGVGVLSPDRQAALVRTWGRSYARLAEWQTRLLADLALDSEDPVDQLSDLAAEVLPLVESLQSYVWRRHLASAASRTLAVESPASPVRSAAVCFVDIVGYTARSKELGEAELVAWLETFEQACADLAVEHGGRVIKNIGDEVLLVADDPADAAEIALVMAARGQDEDDPFPAVRAGLAHGDVVSRLGDVFGPVVNIASRLTSVARPGTVLLDRGAHEALADHPAYTLRQVRRTSVKGYAKLQPWVLRRAPVDDRSEDGVEEDADQAVSES